MTFFDYFIIATVLYIVAVLVICKFMKRMKIYRSSYAIPFAISVVVWYLSVMFLYIWMSLQAFIDLFKLYMFLH